MNQGFVIENPGDYRVEKITYKRKPYYHGGEIYAIKVINPTTNEEIK